MEHFITELRKAHAIATLHARGERTLFGLASRSKLPVAEVRDWASLMQLPLATANRERRGAVVFSSQTGA